MAALRALGRLLRVLAHVLHGGWTMHTRFARWSPAERQAAIQAWSRELLGVIGVRVDAQGQIGPGPRLLIANHVSWLDIPAVHALCPQARFVSKADVHRWPLIGRMAAGAGTLFIERDRKRDALRVVHQTAAALKEGDIVAIFPEGTTGDGHALLPFHANLFQAAISAQVPVQPVLLRFAEPGHPVSPTAAFVGDMTLLGSVWRVLTARGLVVHMEVLPEQFAEAHDRRSLSEAVRARIQTRLDEVLASAGAQ